jgi:hypothetical protein
MNPTSPSTCPLCGAESNDFHRDRRRRYERCPECRLVFVPPEFHVSPADERAAYELHENSPDDPGYRRFLSRTANAVIARTPRGASGLDFGSGPGPTLSVMLTEIGYTVATYDPFFAPDESPLGRTYDFVTATEVVEHLRRPRETIATMWRCVRTNGLLAIMTKMVIDHDAFSRWHYKNDETHVCFFSVETFEWLGTKLDAQPEFIGTDVVVFERAK